MKERRGEKKGWEGEKGKREGEHEMCGVPREEDGWPTQAPSSASTSRGSIQGLPAGRSSPDGQHHANPVLIGCAEPLGATRTMSTTWPRLSYIPSYLGLLWSSFWKKFRIFLDMAAPNPLCIQGKSLCCDAFTLFEKRFPWIEDRSKN